MKIDLNLTRTVIGLFILGLILTVAADLLLIATDRQEHPFPGSTVVGFWAGFGLLWLVVIVALSKLIGKVLLDKPEDYYHEEPEIDGPDGAGEGHYV